MSFDWQDAAALAFVIAAAGYLTRKGWQVMAAKKAGGCGSCSNCPTVAAGKQIVSVDTLTAGRRAAPSKLPADKQTPA